mmetsp:Transcript_22088/g.71124  ORF Transcript_22088/g.71124 Transcript_22088/m.71124 type:complete len:211 (-) Transcript_22088:220-852(-)
MDHSLIFTGLHRDRDGAGAVGGGGGVGDVADGVVVGGCRHQGTSDQVEELDLDHLLRGDGDLRRHPRDPAAVQDRRRVEAARPPRPRLLGLQPVVLRRLRPLLRGHVSRPHERRLGHLRRHRRLGLRPRRRPGLNPLRQNPHRRNLRLRPRHLRHHRRHHPVKRRRVPPLRKGYLDTLNDCKGKDTHPQKQTNKQTHRPPLSSSPTELTD